MTIEHYALVITIEHCALVPILSSTDAYCLY
jgi:hypothetical protein